MSNPERETTPAPEKKTAVPKPPRIFELITSEEPEQQKLEKIIAQIYADFYTAQTDLDRERVVLGLLGAFRAGQYGSRSVENAIAKDTGELGAKAREFVSFLRGNPNADEYAKRTELERLLNIKRYEDIFDHYQINRRDEALARRLYEKYPALRKRFENEGAFLVAYHDRFADDYGDNQRRAFREEKEEELANLTPSQQQYLFDQYAREKDVCIELMSVGACEPSYYELLGPVEILRARQTTDPSFLLIGAFHWSAQEFIQLADKITPKSKKYVIDINKDRISDFQNIEKTVNHFSASWMACDSVFNGDKLTTYSLTIFCGIFKVTKRQCVVWL